MNYKEWFLSVILTLFLLITSSCSRSNMSLTVDFGEVYPHQKNSKTIDIGRYFSQERSLKISSSCNCTAARAQSVSQGVVLSVTLTAGDQIGPNNNMLEVVDDKNRTLNIFVKSTVAKVWDIEPSDIAVFNDIPALKTSSQEIHVTNLKSEDFTIESVHCSVPSIRLETKPVNDKSFSTIVTITPPIDASKIVGEIQIKTTSQKQPAIKFNVFATVKGLIYSEPETIFFGTMRPDKKSVKEITLRTDSIQSFQIKKIDYNEDEMVCRIQKMEDNQYCIECEFTAKDQNGLINDSILVHTNLQEQPTVKIPYSALIVQTQKNRHENS